MRERQAPPAWAKRPQRRPPCPRLVLPTASAGEEPGLIKAYANRSAFDFSDAESEPTQAFTGLPAPDFAGKELKLKATKFSVVNSITLFFDGEDAGRDIIGLSRVRVMGTPIAKADITAIKKC